MMSKEINSLNNKSEIARYNIGIKEAKITSLLAMFSLMTFYFPFLLGVIFVYSVINEVGVLIAVINLSGSVETQKMIIFHDHLLEIFGINLM